MKVVGIIPARYASTRFPGKPLVEIAGKTMIQRVCEQAAKSNLDEVIVATDDVRIADCVKGFGGKVIMTDESHPNGTCRCEEALNQLDVAYDSVVNVQGDEPFIEPEQINQMIDLLKQGAEIATLVKKIEDEATLNDTNKPKVVIGETGRALYFSRQTIPFLRDVPKSEWLNTTAFYKHIGIYGYQSAVLKKLVLLKPGKLEDLEKLEQLRWLENGFAIMTSETTFETIGIDTPADLEKLLHKKS